MRAQILKQVGGPLILDEVAQPLPHSHEVLVKVHACALCRTDLHIIDGELPAPLPLIPGHQIVGSIEAWGSDVKGCKKGDPVGIAWLAKTCGDCFYCEARKENLCDHALFTGFTKQGGFAEYVTADSRFIYPLPSLDPLQAPLLCAGLIGYRALKLCGEGKNIGFYGFGSSAHILIQIAQIKNKQIYVFTHPNDIERQEYARSLKAVWSGGSDERPPSPLDAAIIFATDGQLIPQALSSVKKGGKVVCAGIHMDGIPSFPYSLIWEERTLTTVANLTREDGRECLAMAKQLHPHVTFYSLENINHAIEAMRHKHLPGSAVIIP